MRFFTLKKRKNTHFFIFFLYHFQAKNPYYTCVYCRLFPRRNVITGISKALSSIILVNVVYRDVLNHQKRNDPTENRQGQRTLPSRNPKAKARRPPARRAHRRPPTTLYLIVNCIFAALDNSRNAASKRCLTAFSSLPFACLRNTERKPLTDGRVFLFFLAG